MKQAGNGCSYVCASVVANPGGMRANYWGLRRRRLPPPPHRLNWLSCLGVTNAKIKDRRPCGGRSQGLPAPFLPVSAREVEVVFKRPSTAGCLFVSLFV